MTQQNNNSTDFHSIHFVKTDEERERYNKWCAELKVSSRWDDEDTDNRDFITSLTNAREKLGWRI